MASRSPLVPRILRAAFRQILDFYYRRETCGDGEVPAEGPVVMVANHPNGLVDPVLLTNTTPRTLRFLSKAPLFEMPVVGSIVRGFQALPVYRPQDGGDTAQNERTFEAVYDALAEGHLVCLFPEGKSHSEPSVLKLKTGAARMALGAEARANFELGVRIVPVGLVYRAKRRFRSQIGTCVGKPIHVGEYREAYAADEHAAVRALTQRIHEELEEVTLQLDRWEDLPLIELAAQIAHPEGGERLEFLQRFAEGVHELRQRHDEDVNARLDELGDRIAGFGDRLRALGLSPELLHGEYRPTTVARFVLVNLLKLLLVVPLALVGCVIWALPYLAVPVAARRAKPTRDVHATVQILAGILFLIGWWLAGGIVFGLTLDWQASAGWLFLSPVVGFVALHYLEWRRELWDDLNAFFLLTRRRRLRELLQRDHAELAAEIASLRSELELA